MAKGLFANKEEIKMRITNYIEDAERWQSEFSFYIPVKIRFSETDMYGHVNNVSPFIYFEEARIEYLRAAGLDIHSKENAFIVADLQCDYLKQIYFGDELKIYVKSASIGNTSIDVHYMAVNGKGDIVLTARGRVVHISPETGRPLAISEENKKLLT